MTGLDWSARPALRNPVLVAAFHGWNDGGSAATLAAQSLCTSLGATRFASIDPEEYVDFQQTRPLVSLRDGFTREITWPVTEFFHAPLASGDRDLVVCIGVEPNFRWKAFVAEIAGLAEETGVDLAITFGGLLADTPHTRPVPVSGAAHDAGLVETLGLRQSRYEGPTGIVGVLHDTLAATGVKSASLWAAVPHYIAAQSNPLAALALIERLEHLLDVEFSSDDLKVAGSEFTARIAAVLEDDDDARAYVRELERRSAMEDDPLEDRAEVDLPSGDELAAELQRFLHEHRGGQDSQS